MALASKRGASREGAPQKIANLAGCDLHNSETFANVQMSRAAFVLSRRFRMPMATAATVAGLAGYREIAQ